MYRTWISPSIVAVVVYIVTYGWIATTTTAATQCDAESRATPSGLERCLDQIRGMMRNESLFYYGDNYDRVCSPTSDSLNCYNPGSASASLASRLFEDDAANHTDSIITWLDVKFVSPAGEYTICGNTFTEAARPDFSLNPLHNTTATPWGTRYRPTMTWDAPAGKNYTVLVVDTAFTFLHGMFINVQGNNLLSGHMVYDYSGPFNMRTVINPYAFLLFEQTVPNITVEHPDFRSINASAPVILAFLQRYELGLLKGINWMGIVADPYAGLPQHFSHVSPCGQAIFQSAKDKGIAASVLSAAQASSPQIDILPTVTLDVSLKSPGSSYQDCCGSTMNISKTLLQVNTIGDEVVPSHYLSFPPQVVMSSMALSRNVVLAHLHTLVVTDFDVTNPSFGNKSHPTVHYLVTNIANGLVSTGNTVLAYKSPLPQYGEQAHSYVLLLFRQNGTANVDASRYGHGASATTDGRYLFDLNQMTHDNGMSFAGITWFKMAYDSFVSILLKEQEAICDIDCHTRSCTHDPNYPACSVGSGQVKIMINSFVVMVMVTMAIILNST